MRFTKCKVSRTVEIEWKSGLFNKSIASNPVKNFMYILSNLGPWDEIDSLVISKKSIKEVAQPIFDMFNKSP